MAKKLGRKSARVERAALVADPKALTPEVCDQIVADGGPSYRTTTRGHICNQTGQRLNRGQCFSYGLRVVNGTTAMQAFRANQPRKVVKTATETPRPVMKVLEWDGTNGYRDCPYCHQGLYIGNEGSRWCGYCNREFIVILRQRPVAKKIVYRGVGYYVCPHCGDKTWIDTSGTDSCMHCHNPIDAEWS